MKKAAEGYNVATDKYEDLLSAGVVDPTKVTRSALQNAASIAGLLLTTECVIADKPEKKGRMRQRRSRHGRHGRNGRHGHDVSPPRFFGTMRQIIQALRFSGEPFCMEKKWSSGFERHQPLSI